MGWPADACGLAARPRIISSSSSSSSITPRWAPARLAWACPRQDPPCLQVGGGRCGGRCRGKHNREASLGGGRLCSTGSCLCSAHAFRSSPLQQRRAGRTWLLLLLLLFLLVGHLRRQGEAAGRHQCIDGCWTGRRGRHRCWRAHCAAHLGALLLLLCSSSFFFYTLAKAPCSGSQARQAGAPVPLCHTHLWVSRHGLGHGRLQLLKLREDVWPPAGLRRDPLLRRAGKQVPGMVGGSREGRGGGGRRL